MIGSWITESRKPAWERRRARRYGRHWAPERLEDRVLLTGPTNYTVDFTTDTDYGVGNAGDIAYVVNKANSNTNPAGSVIHFNPAVFNAVTPQTITLTASLFLDETPGPEVVDGPGAGVLTLSGGGVRRVFEVTAGVTTTISDLTINDGLASDGGELGGSTVQGGGLLNDGGSVSLSGVVVSNNRAVGPGGNISAGIAAEGGGIAQLAGALTLTDDAICENAASGGPGVSGSAFRPDRLDQPGGSGGTGSGGGLFVAAGTVNIVNSTIARNEAIGGAGGRGAATNASGKGAPGGSGGEAYAGGLYIGGGIVTLVNATVAGNKVTGGEGGAGGLGTTAYGPSGPSGSATCGGVYAFGSSVTLENTLVALNTADNAASDIAGTVYGLNDLVGTGGSGGLSNGVNHNQVNVVNPGLGPLTSNGGSTLTYALLSGSPAVDAGDVALAVNPETNQPLTTDQRGTGFARTANGAIDIGAFEVQPVPANVAPPPVIVVPPAPVAEVQPAAVVAVSVGWGTQIAALQTAADGLRLLPAGRTTDLPWLGIDKLQVNFNQPVSLTAAEVTVLSLDGRQFGPVTVSGSGSSFTIAFAQPIEKADRVTITIMGTGIAAYTRRLDVLPGDFDDTGVVNNKDATAIHNEWKRKEGTQPPIFGDILGFGTVNGSDYHAAEKRIGTTLPKLGGKIPKAILARALARKHRGVKGQD